MLIDDKDTSWRYLKEDGRQVENTRLLQATKDGNLQEVDAALTRGANVNVQNQHGLTPLMLAAKGLHADDIAIVKLLIEKKALLDVRNDYGQSAFDVMEEAKTTASELITPGEEVDLSGHHKVYTMGHSAAPKLGSLGMLLGMADTAQKGGKATLRDVSMIKGWTEGIGNLLHPEERADTRSIQDDTEYYDEWIDGANGVLYRAQDGRKSNRWEEKKSNKKWIGLPASSDPDDDSKENNFDKLGPPPKPYPSWEAYYVARDVIMPEKHKKLEGDDKDIPFALRPAPFDKPKSEGDGQ
eukprot:gnl/TRDRNA2_/TRDRNA2_146489_c4_seq1.p1 gnl/TRDRNA2_/TRDRNA2_146489_c4~~gnl/TRDRNA2_/TRDRNA2_146489_c4_seq1.p1  ORF type:complete len:297 (-),score=51.61 gnl/TRDRNA2_/TRDRNA2_146489_c4_seq1:149-1039(-)